ncbi:MAG: metallophosphoesterase [Lachnospiraceae bacterium]|nr:metallophosphoesterase [Lachnospiraceae bacterium]
MKILALADKESKNYWDFYRPGKLDGIDLIISCGDLKPAYLTFLATFAHVPILYVMGNHDAVYETTPPEGCICIENSIYVYQGVRILGIGGSMRYKQGPYQFNQNEMNVRVSRLWSKIKKNEGFDILVTHSPAYQIGDGTDLPHTGFKAFNKLLDKNSPRYFLHGHVHATYGREYKRLKTYKNTLIINPYESYLFEYETEYENEFDKIRAREERDRASKQE